MSGLERVVVDASVVVKWFVEEEGSKEALLIRDRYIDGEVEITAPELILFEALNALRYKGLFTESEIKEISESLDAFSFELHSLEGRYARKTVEVAFINNITIYDASYISLAILGNTPMYTADEELIQSLKGEYMPSVKNIKELKRASKVP